MTVAIVDYGSGNLHSARKAFERAARETGASASDITVTADPDIVRKADRIVLPGVGAFADCRSGLAAVEGMVEALDEAARQRARPFLGICVGMQLLATRGLEYETVEGLDWIDGDVVRVEPADPALKVPHMGWNTLTARRPHPLLKDLPMGETGLHAYFVHSYHFRTKDPTAVIAEVEYGGALTAMVGRDNIAGTQFHPEKSQTLGLRLIGNFLRWRP
ncbi:MAG: imidazole glycerol phosphate synthase subunit HisH [Hyphomicrobiales bacterium]|nr:imidazole glycerol phosphate synthase subunit HisH [Hyphomicrobiales bacterium]